MITIKFSCKGCGLKNHALQIPARTDTSITGLEKWMLKMGHWIYDEHKRRSPACRADAMQDLMIPMKHADGTECEFVGQQVE